jgi:hypothetical protein
MSTCCHTFINTCDCIKEEVKIEFIKSIIDIRKALNGETHSITCGSVEVGICSIHKNDKNYYQFNEEDKQMLRCYLVSILGGKINGEYGKSQKWEYDDEYDTLEQKVVYDARNINPKHRNKHKTLMNKIQEMKILFISKKHSRCNEIADITEADQIYTLVVTTKLI